MKWTGKQYITLMLVKNYTFIKKKKLHTPPKLYMLVSVHKTLCILVFNVNNIHLPSHMLARSANHLEI